MWRFVVGVVFMVFGLLLFSVNAYAASSVQKLIDETEAWGTVVIPAGVYVENVSISKPIYVQGNGEVVIQSCKTEPVLSVSNTNVSISGITIEQCTKEKRIPAVQIEGSNHHLWQMEVMTSQVGIELINTVKTVIREVKVTAQNEGNLINLFDSEHNEIHQGMLTKGLDGIYVERSSHNIFTGNQIEQSRYGIHLMFSDNVTLTDNISNNNVTGAMIMETNQVNISNNTFKRNNSNVHAQGILLFHAYNTVITGNSIEENRVGIYVDESETAQIYENVLKNNHIGVQFIQSAKNELTENDFIGNINTLQSIESSANIVDKNYWNDALTLDVDNDQYSDIPYKADPYFLSLIDEVPPYQLFFGAPGLQLIQTLFQSNDKEIMIDHSPKLSRMEESIQTNKIHKTSWGIAAVLIVVSSAVFILGRKIT